VPIPDNIRQRATTPLPSQWFNFTADDSIQDLISIKPNPTLTTPGITTGSPNIFTKDLLNTLKDMGCPYDCHGNGVCMRGMQTRRISCMLY